MLNKHMAACLVATALVAAPVLAQTSAPPPSGSTDRPTATGSGSTTTGSPAMQPNAPGALQPGATGAAPGAAASGASSATAAPAAGGVFLTQLQPSQVMASKLIGTTVVSANNESIGDVNDIVLDRSGQVMAIVIGVGGFLGIGEKDVAISFDELEVGTGPMAPATAGTGGNVDATGSTAGTGASGGQTTAATSPADAGTTARATAASPNRLILRMSKAELQAAPTFRADFGENGGRDASKADAPAPGATGGGTTAPQKQ